MGFIDEIKARAKACKKTIVLPETEDERTYKAAETVLKEGLADLVLVGSKEEIEKNKGTYNISGATIVDPATDARTEGYIAKLVELRQKKGMTPEQAKELLLSNYLYYGVMMVKMRQQRSLRNSHQSLLLTENFSLMQLSFHPLGNLKRREARLQDMLTYLYSQTLMLVILDTNLFRDLLKQKLTVL